MQPFHSINCLKAMILPVSKAFLSKLYIQSIICRFNYIIDFCMVKKSDARRKYVELNHLQLRVTVQAPAF